MRPRSRAITRRTPLPRGKPPKARKADPAKRRWASHRDPAYKWWITRLYCLVCGTQPVDPAHIKHRSTGGDDRENLVPLCRKHHDEQEGRTAAFERKYQLNLGEIAVHLTLEYQGCNWPSKKFLAEFPECRGAVPE